MDYSLGQLFRFKLYHSYKDTTCLAMTRYIFCFVCLCFFILFLQGGKREAPRHVVVSRSSLLCHYFYCFKAFFTLSMLFLGLLVVLLFLGALCCAIVVVCMRWICCWHKLELLLVQGGITGWPFKVS